MVWTFRDQTELPTLHFRWDDSSHCLERMFRVIQHHKVGIKDVGIYRIWKVVMRNGLEVKH